MEYCHILVEPPDVECNLDIVLVHGLNPLGDENHARKTWTHENGTFWPEALLPDLLPTARILLFAYNSSVLRGASNVPVAGHASSLLNDVYNRRLEANENHRPLIFISHSLGGLLVKQGLIEATLNKKYRCLKASTRGLIFFATPHAGGNRAGIADIASKICGVITGEPSNSLLATLEKDSLLSSISSTQFNFQINDYEIQSYYETRRMYVKIRRHKLFRPVTGMKYIVDSQSAKFGPNPLPIDRNHSEICKFSGNQDRIWEKISRNLKSMANNATKKKIECDCLLMKHYSGTPAIKSDGNNGTQDYTATSEELECLQSLWPQGVTYEHQKNQNPERVQDTCLWALENSKYIGWRDDMAKKLIWINADPGCGKSVLARSIVDEDLPKAFPDGSSHRIVYYFFKDISPEQRSAPRAISSILHQLLSREHRLIRHAIDDYRSIGKALATTFSKLWSIFKSVVKDPLAEKIICVFDALDECEEGQLLELIKGLEDFCLPSTSFAFSNAKFLLTGRPYFRIRREFQNLLEASENIELEGNEESAAIKEEIDRVIRVRVKELSSRNILTEKASTYLEERLLATQSRTYLWLHLIWKIIDKELAGTPMEFDRYIDHLPSTIQNAYETVLQHCPNPQFARKVLQIILAAYRPLTLDEIDAAMHVNEQISSYSELDQKLEGASRLQQTLPSRCGLMISIVQGKVYLIHQTVKDFLLSPPDRKPSRASLWQGSIVMEESHQIMWAICRQSLLFEKIQLARTNLLKGLLPERLRRESNDYCQQYSLLSYGTIYWADHYRDKQNDEDVDVVETFLHNPDLQCIYNDFGRDDGPALPAAASGNHGKLVQLLLNRGANTEAKDGEGRTALILASSEDHERTVQILLDKGADINAKDEEGRTALIGASFRGYERIVQILLDKGADIDAKDDNGWTALTLASCQGHEQIVQMLLDRGANINVKDDFGRTALTEASSGGHEQIVQILLDRGADINAKDKEGWTALIEASYQGHEHIVRILLDKGANTEAKNRQGSTALIEASSEGYERTVQMLLDSGADINAKDYRGRTALTWASKEGHERTVQVLLDRGANIDAKGYRGRTALSWASKKGHQRTIQPSYDDEDDDDFEVEQVEKEQDDTGNPQGNASLEKSNS